MFCFHNLSYLNQHLQRMSCKILLARCVLLHGQSLSQEHGESMLVNKAGWKDAVYEKVKERLTLEDEKPSFCSPHYCLCHCLLNIKQDSGLYIRVQTHKYTLAPTSHILHHLYPLGPPCPCHLHCAGDVSV